mmetsp:Transcript_140780/g.450022  ORF Transcript_140780/g.450022 Transcript_140780/m.450022 type:complete len:239 (+) Transcript_140780:2244-2960(+)
MTVSRNPSSVVKTIKKKDSTVSQRGKPGMSVSQPMTKPLAKMLRALKVWKNRLSRTILATYRQPVSSTTIDERFERRLRTRESSRVPSTISSTSANGTCWYSPLSSLPTDIRGDLVDSGSESSLKEMDADLEPHVGDDGGSGSPMPGPKSGAVLKLLCGARPCGAELPSERELGTTSVSPTILRRARISAHFSANLSMTPPPGAFHVALLWGTSLFQDARRACVFIAPAATAEARASK